MIDRSEAAHRLRGLRSPEGVEVTDEGTVRNGGGIPRTRVGEGVQAPHVLRGRLRVGSRARLGGRQMLQAGRRGEQCGADRRGPLRARRPRGRLRAHCAPAAQGRRERLEGTARPVRCRLREPQQHPLGPPAQTARRLMLEAGCRHNQQRL